MLQVCHRRVTTVWQQQMTFLLFLCFFFLIFNDPRTAPAGRLAHWQRDATSQYSEELASIMIPLPYNIAYTEVVLYATRLMMILQFDAQNIPWLTPPFGRSVIGGFMLTIAQAHPRSTPDRCRDGQESLHTHP